MDIGKFSLINTAKFQNKEQEVAPGNLATLNVPEWITRNTFMYSTNIFNNSLFLINMNSGQKAVLTDRFVMATLDESLYRQLDIVGFTKKGTESD